MAAGPHPLDWCATLVWCGRGPIPPLLCKELVLKINLFVVLLLLPLRDVTDISVECVPQLNKGLYRPPSRSSLLALEADVASSPG